MRLRLTTPIYRSLHESIKHLESMNAIALFREPISTVESEGGTKYAMRNGRARAKQILLNFTDIYMYKIKERKLAEKPKLQSISILTKKETNTFLES